MSIARLRDQKFNCGFFGCDDWNDKFSSVHAWTSDVTLYEADGFLGRKVHIGAGGYVSNLGSFNDAASSVKVEKPHTPHLSVSGPSGTIRDSSSFVTFSADATTEIEGAAFACTVDGQPLSGCASPLEVDGAAAAHHVVDVKLTDAWGHTDSRRVEWNVDAVPPALTILDGPNADPGTSSDSPMFRFDIGDAEQVACSLDDPAEAGFRPCTSSRSQSYSKLGDGLHVFRVRAIDPVGNRAMVERSFRIDTIAPRTTLVSGPAEGSRTSDRTAAFRFTSETGVRFECRLDGVAFGTCPGGEAGAARLVDLPSGFRTFEVRAVDRVGNVEPAPAKRTWEVMADADHDGYSPPQDCNDTNPAIHPGAQEVRGNDDDENCDGVAEPYFQITGDVQATWRLLGAHTELARLQAVRVADDTTIEVRCRGPRRACPVRVSRAHLVHGHPHVAVARKLYRHWMPSRTRIEIRLSRPGERGLAVRYVTRNGRRPTRIDRCLPAAAGDAC